jgi:hypothetical protein
MAPWTFNIKFPYDTQFIFESLMFIAGDDGSLKLLTRDPTPRHPTPVYGQPPYLRANSSTSNGACSGLNPYAGPYYLSAKTSHGFLIGKTILQPLAGTSKSSSSGEALDQDSAEDYPEIGNSACYNLAIEAHRINMVSPARENS